MDRQVRRRRSFSYSRTAPQSRSTSINSFRDASSGSHTPQRHRLPPKFRRYHESSSRSRSNGRMHRLKTRSRSSTRHWRPSRSPRRQEWSRDYPPAKTRRRSTPRSRSRRRHHRSRSRSPSRNRNRRSRSRLRKPLRADSTLSQGTFKPRDHQTIQNYIQDAPKTSLVMAVDPSIRHDEPQEQSTPAVLVQRQGQMQPQFSDSLNMTDAMHRFARTSTLDNSGGAGRDPRVSLRKIGEAPKFANLSNLTNAISATVSETYRTSSVYGASPAEGLAMGGITSNEGSHPSIPPAPRATLACSKSVAAKAGLGESPMEVDIAVSQPVKEEATRHHETTKPLGNRDIKHDGDLGCLSTRLSSSIMPSIHSKPSSPVDMPSYPPSQDGDVAPQGLLWDRLKDFSQANSTWIKLRMEHNRLQEKSSGNEGINQENLQKYAKSSLRRCERLIAAMVDQVIQKVNERIQAEGPKCNHCELLEQRIKTLEQQRIDEDVLMARLEKTMESKLDKLVEERLAKRLGAELPSDGQPPKKRKRLNELPRSPKANDAVTVSDLRIAKLENTLTKWDLRLHEALGWEYRAEADPTILPAEDIPKSLKQRIEKLEGDSQQIYGYLSAHHRALCALDSTLSLDPSKPLGQGLSRHLSSLRTEMAQMLTDAFGTLEDSIARMIVGVVIKQTKLEMESSYGRLTKAIQEKFQLNSGEPPNMSNAQSSSLAPPRHPGPGVVLPAIRSLPSMQ